MAQIFPTDDHNTIIRKFADQISKNNPDRYTVYVNLPGEENFEIAGMIPDILLVDPAESKPLIAIEVETAATLKDERVKDRWKPLSEAVSRFQVVIPKGTLNRAKRYCKNLDIKAAFHVL